MENRYGNSNWRRLKIAWLFEDISSGTTPSSTNDEYYKDGEIPWVNTGDLTDGKLFSVNKKISRKAITDYPTLKVHPKNSLIVALYGATIGKLAITQFDVTTNQACCVLNKPRDIDIDFVFYWFLANREGIIQRSVGGGQKNISQGIIRSLRIDVPSVTVQNKIINFLDQKTSEIDTLILDKEKLIALLEEKRQATITEVVTKGLNPDVKMKDSGVEWIGEIPEHWSCYRLKTLITKVQGGTWGKDQQNNENDIPCVRIADFDRTNAKLKETHFTVRNLERQEKLNHLINQGDLLIEKSGGGEKQPVGYAVIFRDKSPTVYTNFIAKLSPNKYLTLPDYLKNIFQVLYFYRINTKSIKQTTGIQNLDLTSYLNEKVMVSPLNEQEEIKNHIIQLNKQTNDLIKTLKETINKLKEYRQSLIYEAVTGKIDVQEMLKETEQEEVSSS